MISLISAPLADFKFPDSITLLESVAKNFLTAQYIEAEA